MHNMDDNTRLDNELADLTDALLSGADRGQPADTEGLDKVVRQLHQIIEPGGGPDPAFRTRLTQRLTQEWDSTQGRGAARSSSSIPFSRRTMRYLAAAAVLIAVVGLALILGSKGPVIGTAVNGEFPWLFAVILLVGLGIAGFIVWRRGR